MENKNKSSKELTIEEEVYLTLESLDNINTGYQVSRFLNGKGYANLTVCPCCRVDDFVHIENCELSKVNKNI